jgi:peptidoglycan/LPS O-acetylase OafA/YrhL
MPGMGRETLLIALVTVVLYLAALLTSHICVRWVLHEHLKTEITNRARYVGIDGIRGYLAFGVFVHHYIIDWLYLRHGRVGSPPHNFENELGKGTVAVFFMITAFLFWGRAHAKRGINVKSFFVSRLFRIYPLYLMFISSLFLAVAYESNWTAHEPASAIAKEFFKWSLFHIVIINRHPGMIFGGVAWTLLYEAWFYLSLPLLAVVFLQRADLWKKALAIGISAALFFFNHLEIAVCAAFLGGVAAVYWILDKRRVRIAESKTASLVALTCLACLGLFVYDPFNPAGIALLSVFFVVIASGNTLFGLLTMPAARWMGEISYSIYLIHGITIWLVMTQIVPRLPGFHPTIPWIVATGIIMAPIVVLSTSASYLAIERPFMAIGHRSSNSGGGQKVRQARG